MIWEFEPEILTHIGEKIAATRKSIFSQTFFFNMISFGIRWDNISFENTPPGTRGVKITSKGLQKAIIALINL